MGERRSEGISISLLMREMFYNSAKNTKQSENNRIMLQKSDYLTIYKKIYIYNRGKWVYSINSLVAKERLEEGALCDFFYFGRGRLTGGEEKDFLYSALRRKLFSPRQSEVHAKFPKQYERRPPICLM